MAKRKPKPKNQRQARYTWRPVVELHWVVVRLNEDGSESFYSRYETEEEAKKTAAVMDKAAQEGREWLAFRILPTLRRIAANVAKLTELMRKANYCCDRTGSYPFDFRQSRNMRLALSCSWTVFACMEQ